LFYGALSVRGDKIISSTIGDYFTFVPLAFWIMDDGLWHSAQSTVYICTDSFTLDEVNLLCEILFGPFSVLQITEYQIWDLL
jgi:hypothetical protein